MKTLDVLIFLGPPGSGKGTQAEILIEKLKYFHLSIGDLLRENITKNDTLIKKDIIMDFLVILLVSIFILND